jgi:hypothetical protein
MSGDLKDPKKSLPLGAKAAVGVGFVVYLGLALFYAFTVDAEALRNDSQILFKISLVPALVIIGIWGATLSSALGSILGAPRILQAIAMDKIAPKVFAKGTGKANEPRNALLLAFVIAEIGILIGELDVIARIVSMFFITTYAFLNLASAIESWSSSDFRPAFKIPRFVSVLGAVSAFIVMILLDFIALTGAVIVLGLLFFYLRRKELVLESGDAWNSFWTNLAKKALLKLTLKKTETRNWRPNILLFSGGQQARPHLVELGLAMSGKLGALTDFELVINSNPYLHTQPMPVDANKKLENHFFKRQFVCDTVESGIKSVTNVYGFSGFEPNTVMMGWSRDAKNATFLSNTLVHLKNKNLNAVFLDYDKNAGFGKKQNIDIWWNGKGRILSFTLNLMRFILADNDWRDANLRILIINSDNQLTDKIFKNTTTLLDEKRVEAEVKIISDDFGTRSKEMIINNESADADLIILGISNKTTSYTSDYIQSIGQLTGLPASILILSPSEEFEEINIVGASVQKNKVDVSPQISQELKPIPLIDNKVVKNRIGQLDESLRLIANSFIEKTIKNAVAQELHFIRTLRELFESNAKNLEKVLEMYSGVQRQKAINRLHLSFFEICSAHFEKEGPKKLAEIKDILLLGIAALTAETGNYIYETSETIIVTLPVQDSKKAKSITVQYRKLVSTLINNYLIPDVQNQFEQFEIKTARLYADLKNIVLQVNDIYEKTNWPTTTIQTDLLNLKEQVWDDFSKLESLIDDQVAECQSNLFTTLRNQVVEISADLDSPDMRRKIKQRIAGKSDLLMEDVEAFPKEWQSNSIVLNNALYLDCKILSEQKIIAGIVQNFNEKAVAVYSENVLKPLELLLLNIQQSIKNPAADIKKVTFVDNQGVRYVFQETYFKISETLERLPEEIEISEYWYKEGDSQNRIENFLPVMVEPLKNARHFFDTLLYEPFYRELEQLDNLVKETVVECREVNSLLRFRIDNALLQISDENFAKDDLIRFLDSIQFKVKSEKIKLIEALERIDIKSDEFIKNAVSPIYSHAILRSGKTISSQVRDQKSKNIGLGFNKKIKGITELYNRVVLGLMYGSSDGVIEARKILKKKADLKMGVTQVLDIADSVMPNPKLLHRIPVFYRTLFSTKSLINDDFWVPMEKEIKGIKNAWQRHRNGYGGAVLVTGVHGCGKTALTRYCSNHYFKKDRTFLLSAPLEGTVKKEIWLAELQNATGIKGDSFDIIRSLPPESVVIVNDLELWWERSKNGLEILKEISDLIHTFGRKVFFILNCNSHSYNIINKIFPMEENLLSVIECNPFDAKKLQQLIESRHKTSGLIYNYKNSTEESISRIKAAALFNSYFLFSEGIPGVAMSAWLANIVKVQGQTVFIKKPELPSIEMLHHLNEDWLVIIALFVQHKNMNSQKLARVLAVSETEAERNITNLVNSGILVAKEKDVYTIARFMEPFLVKVCSDKGII